MSTWKTDYKLKNYLGQKYIKRKLSDRIVFFCANCGSTRIFESGLNAFCETCKAIFNVFPHGRNPSKKLNPFLDFRLIGFNIRLAVILRNISQIKFCYHCGNTRLTRIGIAVECRNCHCNFWGYIDSEKFDGVFRNEYLKESEK